MIEFSNFQGKECLLLFCERTGASISYGKAKWSFVLENFNVMVTGINDKMLQDAVGIEDLERIFVTLTPEIGAPLKINALQAGLILRHKSDIEDFHNGNSLQLLRRIMDQNAPAVTFQDLWEKLDKMVPLERKNTKLNDRIFSFRDSCGEIEIFPASYGNTDRGIKKGALIIKLVKKVR